MRRVIFVLFLLTLAFCAFTIGLMSYFHIHNLIFPNVRVAGVNLGGLSPQKAMGLLERIDKERKFILKISDSREEKYRVSEIGLYYDIDKLLRSAFEIGRKGWLRGFKEAWICLVRGVDLKPDIKWDKKRWERFLVNLRKKVDTPATDARLLVEEGRVVGILPARNGYGVDEKKLFQILSGGNRLTSPVELPMTVLLPKIKEEDLEGMELIGEFSTSLRGSSRSRLENVKKSVSAIDGTLLKPGGEFSFNEKVGPRVSERGYKIAPVMIRGELVPGVGGGVCQVSTTLYNAVLLAGLNVKKRGHHARPVKYVAPGRDATVVWGYVDLVFANDRDFPIYIQGEVKGRRLIFRIFGRKDFDEIRVFSDVERKADGTIIAKTYRAIKKGDDNLTELISTDIYKPLPKKKSPMSFSPHLKMQMEEITD